MRTPGRHRLAVLLAFLTVPAAHGTDRYFSDFSVLSADGKLRLEAKSPDNSGKYRRAFARNFDYTLYDVATSKIIWSRKQPKHEGSPCAAFVHRDRWVVVYSHDDLLVLNGQGTVALELDLLKQGLPPEEVKSYVWETTAGPMWTGSSHWYFLTVGGRPHFGIRTWWDRRIVIALEAGKQVPDEGPVGDAAAAAEKEFALTMLRRGAEAARRWAVKKVPDYSHHDRGPWDDLDDLSSAIHMAGRMGLKEAVPLLLDIERIPSFSSYTSASEASLEGKLLVATYSSDHTRRRAQLALRRLGARPAGYPTNEMRLVGNDGSPAAAYRPPTYTTSRAERIALVARCMESKEVVDMIGPPDYIDRQGLGFDEWAWEYDIDAETPYTYRIVWKRSELVTRMKIEPPVWKDRKTRDMQR